MGANAAPEPCVAPSILSPLLPPPPPPRGGRGQGTHSPPISISVRFRATPATGTIRGFPSWCLEQQCRTPQCPLRDLHAGALGALHKVCVGRHCPTILIRARCADGGRGGWGSQPRRSAPKHPRPHLAPAAPPRPPVEAKVRVRGERRLVPPPSCCLPPPPFSRSARLGWGGAGRCPGSRQRAQYRGKNVAQWAGGPGLRRRGHGCQRGRQCWWQGGGAL